MLEFEFLSPKEGGSVGCFGLGATVMNQGGLVLSEAKSSVSVKKERVWNHWEMKVI